MSSDEYEDDVRGWLAAMRGEAAPPDREALRALREQTAAEFERAGAEPTVHPHPALAQGERASSPSRSPWARRIAAAAAACAAGVALWFAGSSSVASGGDTLADVLRRTADAQSLQLELRRGDNVLEVLVDDDQRARWDEAPGKYTIARGAQLWRIDEAANTAAASEASLFRDGRIDLVALLEEGGLFRLRGAERWLSSTPTGRAEYLGETCLAYERELSAEGRSLRLIAYADVAGRRLQGIVAWPLDGARVPPGPPLAELRLVAVNAPVDESKFVVAQSLTEDGRIGKVLDVQGLVAVQPPRARRWTPVCGPVALKPGDWIRTETRGANAVRVALSSQVELTLGPGGLVELISPTRVRVHSGEVQAKVASTAEGKFTLLGQGDAAETLAAGVEALFRRRKTDDPLARIDAKPPWLAGFEGSSTNESLGSLIATVDGRSVPLSVGYHKVTVDIRDQIARTVIEESFVNHTDGRLEGVFYFPLPADASISGFGMWIGNELVEADVVEKQRAREIYETILRERRDPGLLEWTSGNLFKARVFPIEANSEKRIKLVYTQVLPLRDNRYVYSYGLRSELLRTRPLRELAIDVRVSSELPLRSVTCPTHDVRSEKTDHAGHVQFAAQEYAPTRDFEVVFEIDGRQSDVVVIPHQRGEDGYFLVQLTPPAPAGNWRRDTLRDGEPLELILLCDTSGSMDRESRRQQREFVAAVLSSLGPDDHFTLAACDVECVWAPGSEPDGEVASATWERTEQALNFLDSRRSLGWTNLEQAFAHVLQGTTDNTQVIYIGDGVPSSGDADPQALVARLRRLYDGAPRGTFHAVAVGNLYEATVLKAIASLGGGSQRHIGGEMTPQRTALELLRDVTEPGLRGIAVQFDGVQVAAVYPQQLPNLPAGAQQILVGRYLPQDEEQVGELIVTGRQGEETVRYATTVRFPFSSSSGSLPSVGRVGEGGEASTGLNPSEQGVTPTLTPPHQGEGDGEAEGEGNSFIPRLWARMHLDHLLAQGASQTIQDEIIALSEEFHIITPYTSLLVLETDADRERFGVKRRFQMRDGERFFAEGRDNANYELTQQQMRTAAGWRQGLRMQILAGLSGLGRDAQLIQNFGQMYPERLNLSSLGDYRGPITRGVPMQWAGDMVMPASGPMGGAAGMGGGGFGGRGMSDGSSYFAGARFEMDLDFDMPYVDRSFRNTGREAAEELLRSSLSERLPAMEPSRQLQASSSPTSFDGSFGIWDAEASSSLAAGFDIYVDEMMATGKMMAGYGFAEGREYPATVAPWQMGAEFATPSRRSYMARGTVLVGGLKPSFGRYGYWSNPYAQWLAPLLPAIPVVQPTAKPQAATWPDEAIEVSKSLLRVDALRALEGGIELRRTAESLDPRWDRVSARVEELVLCSPAAWLTRPLGESVHTVVQWCDAHERGALSRAFELGRVRPSTAADRQQIPLGLADDSLHAIHEVYRDWDVQVERPAPDRVVLVLAAKNNPTSSIRLTIDAQRHVLLERQVLVQDEVESTTTFADFAQVAGMWWAQSIETRNADGGVTTRIKQAVEQLADDEFAARLARELPSRAADRGSPTPSAPSAALLIRSPLPSLQRAKEAVADGSAGLEAHLVVLDDLVQHQIWDRAFERLESIEALDPENGSQGVRWIRIALEQAARRNATVLERISAEANRLVDDAEVADRLHVANHLLGVAGSIADANERLALLDVLRPVFDEQPEIVAAQRQWKQQRLSCLQSLGRTADALALEREIAESAPWEVHLQTNYARSLANAGERDAAYARLQQEIDRNPRRLPSDVSTLAVTYADMLHEQGRYDDAADFLSTRVELGPDDQDIYARYLSSLVYADRLDDAESQVREWLEIGEDQASDERLDAPDLARLYAAVSYARGNRHNINVNRTEEKWLAPLAEAAGRFATHEHHSDVAAQILNDWRFTDSDESDALRRELFDPLQRGAATLKPFLLSQLVSWTLGPPSGGDDQAWREIIRTVRQRWSDADDPQLKHDLGQTLATLYASRFGGDEYLPFLRARIDAAAPEYRVGYVSQLFETLISRPWTDGHEAEAFKLLPQLSDAEEEVDRLVVQLPALYRLVDAMVNARVTLARSVLQATGHPEDLTRTEAAAKEAEFLKDAREGVAARLATAADAADGQLAAWLRLEQLTLQVQLDRDLAAVAEACWTILGKSPPAQPASAGGENDDNDSLEADQAALIRQMQSALLDAAYHSRVLALASYLAVRRDSPPERVAQLLAYLDAGIAKGGDAADAWRAAKHDALIALDRPQELERDLRTWIAAGGPVSPWRASLARLLAEQGRLAEAITVFEALRTNNELAPPDLMALARWYQAVDRREDYERATVDAYMAVEEHTLRQMIGQRLDVWWQGNVPLPTELEENVLLAFEALFRKSNSPGDYASLLARFYQACRDFRLLRMIPDAVIGRTQQQVYPFLESLNSQLLGEVRDEAVADEMLGRIAELRARELTSLDARALDLLEAMIERRSSEVLNQPGPHVDAAVAALERAFRGEWADGEAVQMAKLLANLGRITAPELAELQVRQLRALHAQSAAGSLDRLRMAQWLAHALFWSFDRQDEALAVLDGAVREYERACEGRWPQDATEPLDAFVGLLENRSRYAEAETVLVRLARTPATPDMANWFAERLDRTYLAALIGDGQVSLGRGEELYHNLVDHIDQELETADHDHRYHLVMRLTEVFYHANEKPSLAALAKQDMRRFAFERTPGLLARQTSNYDSVVQHVAERVRHINGPRDGLEFLIGRIESYPPWLEMSWNNAWQQHGYRLGEWRSEVGDANLGDLEAPLLRIVERELRRDLESRESRSRYLYHDDYGYFWEAKRDVFAADAREVLRERRTSGRSVKYIADYLWSGVDRRGDAIQALFVAHGDGILDDGGQQQLVVYLHYEGRYGESIALLEPLIERLPNNLNTRRQLMLALFKTDRLEERDRVRSAADEYFRQAGRWNEGVAATLGDACREAGMHELAVGYYQEAISLVQRQQPGGGVGGDALPRYYRGLAESLATLGKTPEAVDAAAGAVVAWGPRSDQRGASIEALRQVLKQAADLDAYVATLDAKVDETGQDSPLIRRLIGEIYIERRNYAAAQRQLRLAVALEPNDFETQQKLLEAIDLADDAAAAVDQLLAMIDLDRRNLTLYVDLARRPGLDAAEAERAATAIVEASPQEAENHAALADWRQQQDRWAEAVDHWRHVARIRSLEPDGLVKLATALVHLQRWDDADEAVRQLLAKQWPARFQELPAQIRQLQQQIAAGRDE